MSTDAWDLSMHNKEMFIPRLARHAHLQKRLLWVGFIPVQQIPQLKEHLHLHRGPGTEGWYSLQRCPPLLLTSRYRATARYMETLEHMMLNRRPQGPCPRWRSSPWSCVADPRCPPRRTRYHRRATARLQCVVCGGVHRSGQGQWLSPSMSGAPWRTIFGRQGQV